MEWRVERRTWGTGTGIGYRGYGMIDGSRVWSGNCEGQETEEMTWEVGHGLWEITYRKRTAGEGRGWREKRTWCADSEAWNVDLIK